MNTTKGFKRVIFNNKRVVDKIANYTQILWEGYNGEIKQKQVVVIGLKEQIISQIYDRYDISNQERDYLLRNVDSFPIPEIFGAYFRAIGVSMQTDWDEIIRNLKNNKKFVVKTRALKRMAQKRSKQVSTISFKIFKVAKAPEELQKLIDAIKNDYNIKKITEVKRIMISIGNDITYEFI